MCYVRGWHCSGVVVLTAVCERQALLLFTNHTEALLGVAILGLLCVKPADPSWPRCCMC